MSLDDKTIHDSKALRENDKYLKEQEEAVNLKCIDTVDCPCHYCEEIRKPLQDKITELEATGKLKDILLAKYKKDTVAIKKLMADTEAEQAEHLNSPVQENRVRACALFSFIDALEQKLKDTPTDEVT